MITDAELDTQIERVFWITDKDRSGTISKPELYVTLTKHGYQLSREEFEVSDLEM